MDGRVPADAEGHCRDILCGQSQGHGHLVDMDAPVGKELRPVEQPQSPNGPGGGDLGKEDARKEVEATVGVSGDRPLVVSPRQLDPVGNLDAGSGKDAFDHVDRRDGGIHRLGTDRAGRDRYRTRVLEDHDVGVTEHGRAVDPGFGQAAGLRQSCCSAGSGRQSPRSCCTETPLSASWPRTSVDGLPTTCTVRSLGSTSATSVRHANHRSASRWKRGSASTTQANVPRRGERARSRSRALTLLSGCPPGYGTAAWDWPVPSSGRQRRSPRAGGHRRMWPASDG